MSIMELATAHFQARMTGELRQIEVPEWQTTLYHRPSWSLKQQAPVSKLNAQGRGEEALAQQLIIRALDADGNRLFKQADMTELMNKTDPDIITRIIVGMNSDTLTDEAAAKN